MSVVTSKTKNFARDCLLIIISILAALGVNEWRVWSGERAELKAAVQDMSVEIAENLALLNGVNAYQQKLSGLIAEVANSEISDQTPMELIRPVAGQVSGERNSFIGIDGVFQSVSWDMAKDRGVVARMNYDTAKSLAFVHDSLLPGLRDYNLALANRFTSVELHTPSNQRAILMELSARFAEAGSRAAFVEDYLRQAQGSLISEYPDLLDAQP